MLLLILSVFFMFLSPTSGCDFQHNTTLYSHIPSSEQEVM